MAAAQGLPIPPIPEKLLVALVRMNVVDHLRLINPALRLAHHTKGMLPKKRFPGLAPPIVVAALRWGFTSAPGSLGHGVWGNSTQTKQKPRSEGDGAFIVMAHAPAQAGGALCVFADR
jgi:hypothetical protein